MSWLIFYEMDSSEFIMNLKYVVTKVANAHD